MQIRYELENAGWANATIEDGAQSSKMEVSYLHDSLKQLLDAIIALIEGDKKKTIVFMSEPGEHQLVLKADASGLIYELLWFDDWASWDMHPKDKFKQVMSGRFDVQPLSECVLSQVENIYIQHGIEGYKQKWIEHDFPYNQYMKLKRLLKNRHGLSELIAGITAENMHGEIDTGDSVGNEVC